MLSRVRGVDDVDEVSWAAAELATVHWLWLLLLAEQLVLCTPPPLSLSQSRCAVQEFADLIEAVRLANMVKRPWHNLLKKRYRCSHACALIRTAIAVHLQCWDGELHRPGCGLCTWGCTCCGARAIDKLC